MVPAECDLRYDGSNVFIKHSLKVIDYAFGGRYTPARSVQNEIQAFCAR